MAQDIFLKFYSYAYIYHKYNNMKKLRITAAMAITALLLAGCDNEEQKVVPDPIINVDTETVIELPPAGGSASFVYSIDNPVENGRLEAEPSDTWMSDFTTTDDEVRFRVEANETEELREGTVSLTYVYGEDKTVNAVVNVSQAVMQSSEEPVPVITITTEEPLALAADGGSYTIEYEITDPAEDGSISADAGDAGWITDINCDTDGAITFSVAANDTEEERQATITVTYTYNGTETVSDAITVSQPPVPTITITTEEPLALAADGGSYTIEYEITDPAEDGSISADAGDAGWITDINCDTDGAITFSVAANDTEEERQATITVTYTYNGTETVSDAITVSQPPVPTITITTEEPLALAADGGSYTIEYEITDPAEDGSISADAGDAGWITDINCDTDGAITFSVAANDTEEERQATITVTYTYNGTETVSESIEAVQEANEPPAPQYDFEHEMINLDIINYGGSPCNYYITMSNSEKNLYGTARYVFDIYADSDSSMPPAGTYTITTDMADMTASSGFSSTIIKDESGTVIVNCKLAEGTITITYEGSTMILDAVVTDTEGNIHHVTYN